MKVIITIPFYTAVDYPQKGLWAIPDVEGMSGLNIEVNGEKIYFYKYEEELYFLEETVSWWVFELKFPKNDSGELIITYNQEMESYAYPKFLNISNPLKERLFPLDYYIAPVRCMIDHRIFGSVEIFPPKHFTVDQKQSGIYVTEPLMTKRS